jgi:hypothetical protein
MHVCQFAISILSAIGYHCTRTPAAHIVLCVICAAFLCLLLPRYAGTLPEAFGAPPHLVVPPTPSSSSKRRHKPAKPTLTSPDMLCPAHQHHQDVWSPAAPAAAGPAAAHAAAAAALQLGLGGYGRYNAGHSSSMGGSSSSSQPAHEEPAALELGDDVHGAAEQQGRKAGGAKRKAAVAEQGPGSKAKRSRAAARR